MYLCRQFHAVGVTAVLYLIKHTNSVPRAQVQNVYEVGNNQKMPTAPPMYASVTAVPVTHEEMTMFPHAQVVDDGYP